MKAQREGAQQDGAERGDLWLAQGILAVLALLGVAAGVALWAPAPAQAATATLTVTRVGTGSGTIISEPAGISCPGDCTEIYTTGTSVTVTATAAGGSLFLGWSGGGCSGPAGGCTVVVGADTTVTANFQLSPLALAALPLRGDFDGDHRQDLAFWQSVNGAWSILDSRTGTPRVVGWGAPFDIPVPGDYTGDGRTDIAVFRSSVGAWLVLTDPATGTGFTAGWGRQGDIPVQGDYDGDHRTDLAVWRPSDGGWYIVHSSTGANRIVGWGAPGDLPIPADYDGDGKTDIAVFRPNEGTWFIVLSSTGQIRVVSWGAAGDLPVPSDYDGDGKADIAVWRPVQGSQEGIWYVLRSLDGGASIQQFGSNSLGDVPVPVDFAGLGRVQLGIFRTTTGEFFLAPLGP